MDWRDQQYVYLTLSELVCKTFSFIWGHSMLKMLSPPTLNIADARDRREDWASSFSYLPRKAMVIIFYFMNEFYDNKTWLLFVQGVRNNEIIRSRKRIKTWMCYACLMALMKRTKAIYLSYKKCSLLSIYLFYIEIIKTNPSDNTINRQPFFHLDRIRCWMLFMEINTNYTCDNE